MLLRSASPFIVFLIVISFILQCDQPLDPTDPSNTRVELLIRDSHGLQSNSSITDTVDNPIRIGLAFYLTPYIDSIKFSVKVEGKAIYDTMLRSFSSRIKDTIWKSMSFPDPGYKLVSIVPYSREVTLLPVSADITIVKKSSPLQPGNHPPKWSETTLNVALNDTARYELNLSSLCSDLDKDVLHYAISGIALPGDTIIDGLYAFHASAATIGRNRVELVASDPSGLKDTMELVLIITASGSDDYPPEVTIVAPVIDSSVVNSENCVVDLLCSDASGIDSVYAVFNGKTIFAVLENGHYKISITSLVAGVYNAIQLTARDKSINGLKTTKTIKIKYVQSFTITYSGNGNSSGAIPTDTVKYETGATATVKGNTGNLVKTGFTFLGWATSASGTVEYKGEETFKMGTSDVTLYAIWKQNTTFTLTITSTNGQVAISPNATVFDSGTIVTLTPVPSSNYHFSGWSGALSGTANPATITMNSAKSVIANFEANAPNAFTLNVLAPNGTVQKTPDQTQYDSGSVVTLTAVPDAGYQFTGWSGGITGITNPTSVTMNAAKSVVANFAPKAYTLSIVATNGSVTKSPDANSYDSGIVVMLTAVPNAGYQFTGWSGGLTGTTNPTSVTMNAAKSVTANFTLKKFALSITSSNGSVSKSSNADSFDSGTVVILTAVPDAGYQFTGWSGGLTGTTNPSSITIDAAKSVTAIFIKTFTVTYDANGGGTGGIDGSHGTGTVPKDSKVYITDDIVTVLDNPGNLTRIGYVFGGWSKAANDKKSKLTTFKMGSANVTLYARWLIMDASGYEYDEVKIGNQVWMVQNLKTAKLNNNKTIPYVTTNAASYQVSDFGVFYNGYAIMEDTNRMLAPPGWRVSTYDDWQTLKTTVNDNAKSLAANEYWTESSTEDAVGYQSSTTNNERGFTAYPEGCYVFTDGTGTTREYRLGREEAQFWTTDFSERQLGFVGNYFSINYDLSGIGFVYERDANDFRSVRCIREY